MRFSLPAAAATVFLALPAGADTLTFDGLFEQVAAERQDVIDSKSGSMDLTGSFTEGEFRIDYYANDIVSFWPDGWKPGTLGIHDGRFGGDGSEFDETRISRTDGRPFDLESFVISKALTSYVGIIEAYDFATADFDLLPLWDDVTDVDTISVDSLAFSYWESTGLSREEGWEEALDTVLAFWDTVTVAIPYTGEYLTYDSVELTGIKTDGTEVVAKVDPFRDYPSAVGEWGPPQRDQLFTAADFGTGFTDLMSLDLQIAPEQGAIQAKYADLYPIFSTDNLGADGLHRSGTVVGFFDYYSTGWRNDNVAVWFSEMTLVPIPLPAPALLLGVGLAGLGLLRRRG